jgi:hypothetical protein
MAMMFEDLPALWRSRHAEMDTPSPEQVLRRVEERSRRLEGIVRRRDRLETAVALAIAPFFAAVVVLALHPLTRIGAAILTVSCLAIPLRLASSRRAFGPGRADRTTAEFLRDERERVLAQKRLLRTVLWWYLLPLGIGVVLLFGGMRPLADATLYAVAVVILYGAIYVLNQRAVATELDPRLAELETLLAALPGCEAAEA